MNGNFQSSEMAWEQRFCPTGWCTAQTVYARPHEYQREVWHVTESVDAVDWLVAATGPVCPLCGGNLLTAANVLEGVDGAELDKKVRS